jgi:sn-glycerol 3-phosphate transport system substrate-binding protein
VKVATLWQDMVFKDKTAMPSNTHNDLINKKVAMVFGSTGSMGNLLGRTDFQVVAGFMPKGTRNQVPVGGAVLAITSSDKFRQAAAFEFMKFMTSAESEADIVIKTGYMPVSESSMNHPRVVEYFKANPGRAVAVDQLKYVRPQATVISLGKGTEIFRQLVEKLIIATVDPRKALQEAAADLTKEYNENYK